MLKLHAGISKKVGLPGFSSASASCTIEAELDSGLLNDTEGFRLVVQRTYQSCEQAAQDQIARLTVQEIPAPRTADHAQDISAQPHYTIGPQTRSQGLPARAPASRRTSWPPPRWSSTRSGGRLNCRANPVVQPCSVQQCGRWLPTRTQSMLANACT